MKGMELNKQLISCVSLLSYHLSLHEDKQLGGAALAVNTA